MKMIRTERGIKLKFDDSAPDQWYKSIYRQLVPGSTWYSIQENMEVGQVIDIDWTKDYEKYKDIL